MIKTYVKIAPIQAEQFDGSEQMIWDYGMDVSTDHGGILRTSIHTREGWLKINTGDWIATGVNGEHWPIADDIFQKTYAELPVIPREVADYIQKAKRGVWGILDVFWHIGDSASAVGVSGMYDWQQWVVHHQDAVARAWLDGYQIEEAPDETLCSEER